MKICGLVVGPWARFAAHGTVGVGVARMLKPNGFCGSFNAANGEITMGA